LVYAACSENTSGRRSSRFTSPPVARSIAAHRVAGIGLVPLAHWLTKLTDTPTISAMRVGPPTNSIARFIAIMRITKTNMSQILSIAWFKCKPCLATFNSNAYKLLA
jgi:hypothetical protein